MSIASAQTAQTASLPELPNIVGLLAQYFHGTPMAHFLHTWESVIYSLFVILFLMVIVLLSTRKMSTRPHFLQNLLEMYVSGVDSFVGTVLGKKGREFTPFIGTLFVYILLSNCLGLIPFFKSPSADLSMTFAIAVIVFCYVQSIACREYGFFGYVDHLMGSPRGFIAITLILPLFMFFLHLIGELIKPISLSLRLRSIVWGDEVLLGLLASWGIKGVAILFINYILVVIASVIQAVVFSMLTLVYLAIILCHDEENHKEEIKEENVLLKQ